MRTVGTRRLKMLTLDYLVTHKAEECPGVSYTPYHLLLHPAFKNLLLGAFQEFGPLEN